MIQIRTALWERGILCCVHMIPGCHIFTDFSDLLGESAAFGPATEAHNAHRVWLRYRRHWRLEMRKLIDMILAHHCQVKSPLAGPGVVWNFRHDCNKQPNCRQEQRA